MSVLQQARKAAGLEVTDRVRVVFDSTDAEVVEAINRHAPWIAEEVLAVDEKGEKVRLNLKRDSSAETAEAINGRPVTYSLAKA